MSIRLLPGFLALATLGTSALASHHDFLIRFRKQDPASQQRFLRRNGGHLDVVSKAGNLYRWVSDQRINFTWDSNVQYVQRNHTLELLGNPSLEGQRAALTDAIEKDADLGGDEPTFTDNPEMQAPPAETPGTDPLLAQQWGMHLIGADGAFQRTKQGHDVIVAVIDSGIDYNHQDLIANLWHNPRETAGNGTDDDKNGLTDDTIGWDFVSDDNRPYDLSASILDILLKGGNPGHGTHVSGVVAARLNNGMGGAGVAPQAKIMPLRFVNESGKGDDAAAIRAIDYAVANGANIINASWGGEKGDDDDSALREAIQRAEKKGVIFVAAAGNGRLNQQTMTADGYDNDSDPKPIVPASYPFSNVVAVAAIGADGKLAPFSNWGHKSVKIAAPGVKVMSTVPGNRYQDTIVDLGGMQATWDGTSMAAPFVAGTLAVIWSQDRSQSMDAVIAKLLAIAEPLDSLKDKVSSGARVDLKRLGE